MNENANTTISAGAAPGWMVVRLGDARVALAIEEVGEVLPVPELAPVPMAPAWVAGVASVRGAVVPVVDLAMRLFGTPAAADGRMVLTRADDTGEAVGLLVDAVAGLIERAGARTETGNVGGALPAGFVTGRVARGDEAGTPVLDLRAVLEP